ncbi:MAG: hypothetical protein H7Y27_02810, partial [Gemmatimonadaceae bacterium]|nr:hypothetical protein [Chitinophagaceae bacterium]
MKKAFALLTVIIVFAGSSSIAQQSRLDSLFAKGDTTAVIDSLMEGFDAYLDSLTKPKSFATVSVGIGNRSFSVNNNSLNTQATASKLSFTPSIGYYHKSGLGISGTAFIAGFQGKAKVYQYALTPSFDYMGENISAGVSYTRYFEKDTAIQSVSPYTNDLYAYASFNRRSWRYGIAAGFATGEFNDKMIYRDSVLRYNPLTQRIEFFYFNI